MPAKTETVLLVDDEDSIILITRIVLERNGYRVLAAKTGPAALAILDAERGQIDLLLADVVLPGGMSGPELAERVRVVVPGVKVIFSTGYDIEVVAKDLVKEEGVTLLQKPYETPSLLQMIRTALDGG